ncbi:MAG: alpha/beta fold hydrolase [Acidimicrobiia bacterium]
MVATGRARWLIGLVLVAGVLIPPPAPSGAADAACLDDVVPVALGPGRPADQRIVVELCGPAPLEGRAVHLLISGATYGPLAWDFPYQPERYSYVRAMNEAGIATLNVTRLGMADSSHPDSAEVNTPAQIFIYSQLIDALRGGRFGAAFGKVVIVGHSYGSVIAYGVGNRHADKVDGVIVTGLQHEFDAAFLREFWGNLRSANEEGGRFADLDDGYLTSRAGQRHVFYRQSQVDPKIIEMDEATKETFTREDARTFPPVMGESDGITVPVLDVIGEYDAWFCAGSPCSAPGATTSRSRQWFDATSCFEQYVVPEAGHDINVHFTAQQWFDVAAEWTGRMVAGAGPCRTPAG